MPTYEYECKNCSHSFEVFQSMSDPPLKTCPKCGSEVRRLIFGGAGVIFKGSGFYVTDKNKSSASVSGAAKTDKKPDAKPSSTEAKPSTGESAPSTSSATPASTAATACGGCPNKGASPSCPA